MQSSSRAISSWWDERTSAVIPEEEIFYTVGFLRFATSQADLKYLEDQNKEILNFCNGAGIKYKRYLSYIENNAEWKKHLGEKWDKKQAPCTLSILHNLYTTCGET
ncbi:hypothetical protein AAC387_Pa11g0805 [Persea americana]